MSVDVGPGVRVRAAGDGRSELAGSKAKTVASGYASEKKTDAAPTFAPTSITTLTSRTNGIRG